MSLTDFLFNGETPPAVSTLSSTSANLPDWWQEYLKGTVAKANVLAAEPYQAYTGPRVADLTSQQTQAYGDISAMQGAAQPKFDAAGNLISTGGATSSLAAADPTIQGALSLSPTGAASSYLTAASATAPGALSSYMSPYTDAVVNRIAELGNRNLMENVLPGVQDTFIGAGQAGSTRNTEFVNRAIRDNQEAILGQQAGALESGDTEAGNLFNADQARLAGLASTAGGLAGTEMGQLGTLAQLQGQLTSDTANRQITAGQQLGALGQTQQQTSLSDAAALEAAGAAQQTQQQKNLDTAYQQFVEERDYPKSQVDWINQTLRGLTPPASTTATTTGPATTVGASPLAQLAGAGLSATALYKALGSAAGGRVRVPARRYSRGGAVGALRFARAA